MAHSVTEGDLTTFSGHSDVGLGFIGAAGLISAIFTFCLLVYLLVEPVRRAVSTSDVSRGVSQFLRDPLGWYLVQMLVSDFLQGVGFVINLHWARHSALWLGPACTAQGFVTEIGDVGCAIFSLLISLHTFIVLFLRRTPPAWSVLLVSVLSWALVLILTVIGPVHLERVKGRGRFYGNSGAWCWISSGYQVERSFFLYFFVFAAVISSWGCYILLFLRERRAAHRVAQAERRRELSGKASVLSAGESALIGIEAGVLEDETLKKEDENRIQAVSSRMLYYPALYSVVVIPVSISRLSVMNNTPVPLGFVMFSGILFASSGTVNVILWLATRQAYIVREARRISYAVTTTVDVSPPSDYTLEEIHGGSLGDTDALRAAELDLKARELVHPPFVDGEEVHFAVTLQREGRKKWRKGRARMDSWETVVDRASQAGEMPKRDSMLEGARKEP